MFFNSIIDSAIVKSLVQRKEREATISYFFADI